MVLYVKEIVSQYVVTGWYLIPVTRSRLRTSVNADYCLKGRSLQEFSDAFRLISLLLEKPQKGIHDIGIILGSTMRVYFIEGLL